MADQVPTGIVTLVFTDIEDSCGIWESSGSGATLALAAHNEIVRKAAASNQGSEIESEGDSFFLAFNTASDAINFAVEAQRSINAYDWTRSLGDRGAVRIRIGIHTGEAQVSRRPDGRADYVGRTTNRAARVADAGHGGQILLSGAAHSLVHAELSPEISLRDLGSHRLKGIGEEHLWQVCHPSLDVDFPPVRTLNPAKHNLPIPLTEFIGREASIQAWAEQLRQPSVRMLTLTGPGGIGKTRAAQELAESLLEDYEDGVWWIELAEARDGDAMIERIAYHLHFHRLPQPSIKEQLCSYLKQRRLMLVLDNVEQIRDAPVVLGELLNSAASVDWLITSRRPLEIRAEHVVSVRPLTSLESQTLFAERAASRDHAFEIGSQNRTDVADLCARLEGIPLAIELAASRIASLSPREILERVSERFSLLRSATADLPARQRALQGTIDWSYDLLTHENQSLFAQISVFAGGFTLIDAEAVCENCDVLDGVAELCKSSLLRGEVDPNSQKTRYLMLESVREYAGDKLNEFADGGATVKDRHLEHFLRFGELRILQMRTKQERSALKELDRESDNLSAALRRAKNTSQNEACVRVSLCLYHRLYRRGFWAEARRHLELACQIAYEKSRISATAGCHLAILMVQMGGLEDASALAERSLLQWRDIGDRQGIADALFAQGFERVTAGDTERAEALFAESRDLLDPSDHARLGHVLRNLANLAARRGEWDEIKPMYETALRHARDCGDERNEAMILNNMGGTAQNVGDMHAAKHYYFQSLALCRSLNDLSTLGVLLNNLGELAEMEGDVRSAVLYFAHSEKLFREVQSAHLAIPQAALQRIESSMSHSEYSDLYSSAGETTLDQLLPSSSK